MVYINKIFNNFFYKNSIALIFFKIGIFLLPTAFVISAIFLLIAACLASLQRSTNYIKDGWNFPLVITSILMIISSLTNKFSVQTKIDFSSWNSNLAIVDLINWLPFFFLFWAFGDFVGTTKRRKECAILFISGSVPLLISGFLQLVTSIHGPFKLFNGFIVWYQEVLGINEGVSSIFSNANYYASWLLIIWPFSLASFLQINTNDRKNKIISLILLVAISLSIVLTRSRSAWGSLSLSIPLMLGTGSLVWLIPALIIIFSMIFFAVSPTNDSIQVFFNL